MRFSRLPYFMFLAAVSFASPCVAQAAPAHEPVEDPSSVVSCTIETTMMPQRAEHHFQFTLEGTLAESWRTHMDSTLDGNISLEESQSFLQQLNALTAQSFRARIDGAALPLVPLQEPECDYLQDRGVNDCPLTLHLAFVCTLPRGLTRPQQLILEWNFLSGEEVVVKWEAQTAQDNAPLSLLGQLEDNLQPEAESVWRSVRLPLTTPGRMAEKSPENASQAKPQKPGRLEQANPQEEAARKKFRQRIQYFRQGPIQRAH